MLELLKAHTQPAFRQAYEMAAALIIENPHCWRAHRGLAQALIQMHHSHFGLRHMRTARAGAALEQGISSDAVVMLECEIGQALLMAGKPELAAATYEQVLQRRPAHTVATNGLERANTKLTAIGARQENGYPLLNRAHELERAGDYAGAWTAMQTAKQQLMKRGYVYDAGPVQTRFERYSRWCSREKMRALEDVRLIPMGEPVRPIFVLGYPRSGTTLLEQIICAHPDVIGGGELPFVHETATIAPRFLQSREPYPDCLDELLVADTAIAATLLRQFYLARVVERFPHARSFLTDKMPLNETHLPLLHLIFPESPLLLIRRDPLDVVMSNYSLFLTHGSHQACTPASCYHHLSLVHDLVEHYRRKITGLNLMVVSYEQLVAEPEPVVRAIAQFCNLAFDPVMLRPESNRRYAHTASYAQIRRPINSQGVGRWRRYESQLRAAIPEAFAQ